MINKKHYINGKWVVGKGQSFTKVNPSTGKKLGSIKSADAKQVDQAFQSARQAFGTWAGLSTEKRYAQVRRFARELNKQKGELAELISLEVGKPEWESATEVQAMVGKVEISIDAFEKRCGEFTGGPAVTRFRPHGVVGVLGPFNFPGHLPNGHIVPALIAGNTVVLKPSELAPFTAAKMVEIWQAASLPNGVLNLVQGGRETGGALVNHEQLDGLFFTGSAQVGEMLTQVLAKRPGKMLALEMGGNNALVVEPVNDLDAAVLIAIQSAFLTAGQRCTCARRLIVPEGKWADKFLHRLIEVAQQIEVGLPEENVFMGPVISSSVAESILSQQRKLIRKGAQALLKSNLVDQDTGLLTPGILDVTNVEPNKIPDEEIFGPLLQVYRVANFDAAIAKANDTHFGLAAGLVSDSLRKWQRFQREIRCGVVNWNQQTTGASSAAPFGGIGRSGNFRPSAYFAADYCSWPMASIEVDAPRLPDQMPPGISLNGNG